MAEPADGPEPCVECGARMPGVFCSACGARRDVEPLSLRRAFASLLELDFPMWHTTRDLLVRPGAVARAWIDGRRRTYANPIRYCLITSVLVAFATPLSPAWQTLSESDQNAAAFFTEYLGFIALVLIVPLAMIMRALTRLIGMTRPWLDWYVVAAYAMGITVPLQFPVGLTGLPIGGVLPIVWFSFTAWGFDEPRGRLLTSSLIAQLIWLVAIAGVGVAVTAAWSVAG